MKKCHDLEKCEVCERMLKVLELAKKQDMPTDFVLTTLLFRAEHLLEEFNKNIYGHRN